MWDVIVDFPAYHEWNPFIVRAAGEPATGSRLTLDFQPPGGKPTTARPTVTAAEPGRRLQWLGTVRWPFLFAARHELAVEPDGDGTILRHREWFTGLLVPLVKRTLRQAEAGFERMNHALKERAEA